MNCSHNNVFRFCFFLFARVLTTLPHLACRYPLPDSEIPQANQLKKKKKDFLFSLTAQFTSGGCVHHLVIARQKNYSHSSVHHPQQRRFRTWFTQTEHPQPPSECCPSDFCQRLKLKISWTGVSARHSESHCICGHTRSVQHPPPPADPTHHQVSQRLFSPECPRQRVRKIIY